MKLALAIVAALAVPASANCPVGPGDRMPVLKGTDENGRPTTTKADGWSFVSIGASWCQPCKKELPVWDALAKTYAAKATYFAVDIDDKPASGIQFHHSLSLAHMRGVYVDPDAIGNLADTMPTTYLVDPKGVVRYVVCGYSASNAQPMDAQLKKLP